MHGYKWPINAPSSSTAPAQSSHLIFRRPVVRSKYASRPRRYQLISSAASPAGRELLRGAARQNPRDHPPYARAQNVGDVGNSQSCMGSEFAYHTRRRTYAAGPPAQRARTDLRSRPMAGRRRRSRRRRWSCTSATSPPASVENQTLCIRFSVERRIKTLEFVMHVRA